MIAVQNLCSRAVWLRDGKVVQKGSSATVVAKYLAEQGGVETDKRWPDLKSAPGSKLVKLLRVWVETESGNGTIVREKPIEIGVEYYKLKPDVELHITLHIFADHQVVAFTAASSDDPSWRDEEAGRSGRFRSVCHIPECLLNAGQYRVKVIVMQNRSRNTFVLNSALVFDVLESHQRKVAWYGKEPGVVRPDLRWTNSYLGEVADSTN